VSDSDSRSRDAVKIDEELILLVVDELESHAKAAATLALSLRLAAGMAPSGAEGGDPDFEARVTELMKKAHDLLAGDGRSSSGAPAEPDPYEELPVILRPPTRSSRPVPRRRVTPAYVVPPSSGRMSSGPPPAESGVRRRKSALLHEQRVHEQRAHDQRPAASASESTPRGFATNDLRRWYESLTKSTTRE
jgi:hypothetical protein